MVQNSTKIFNQSMSEIIHQPIFSGVIVSVSGVSSGGYAAVQYHLSFSSTLVGVGVVAGGPYCK